MMTGTFILLLQTAGASSGKSPILGYIPIALLLLVALLLPFLLWALSGFLTRKSAADEQSENEASESQIVAPARVPGRYYVLAMLYVVFAAQLVFIIPWAVIFDRLALFGLAEMLISFLVLAIGYYYAWRNGALEESDGVVG